MARVEHNISSPKVAVIGCGHWGKNLVRNYAELGHLAAICDQDEEQAKSLGNQYNVAVRAYDDILEDKAIVAVVIATPAATHADFARQALENDKQVFIEKPLGTAIEAAESLCRLARERDKILMVGHLLQYHSAFLKLKEIVIEGGLGRLQYIYSHRMSLGKFRREENVLWSFAPHDISMILSLAAEPPSKVTATGSKLLHERIHDVATTHLEFENGIRAHVLVSWLHPFKEQKLVVVGDQGMAVFNDRLPWNQKLTLYPHGVEWENGMPVPNVADGKPVALEEAEPLKEECRHFIECIRTKRTPRTDGLEGLQVLKVLDQAQKCLDRESGTGQAGHRKYGEDMGVFIHDTSVVDEQVTIGKGTKIWHYSHILKNVEIGQNCTIGQNVMIGPDVTVSDGCKIQNNVSLYKGIRLEDEVFCGPSCVFTNVINPRAAIERKDEFKDTLVKKGATIGANATILCGITLGRYSLIGAGAVVTKDVPAHALVVGNPARQVGWVSRTGAKLGDDLVCPDEGYVYKETENGLELVDTGESKEGTYS